MRRRDFITLLAGATTWPLAARAQQADRMRRIGVLVGWSDADPEHRKWLDAFAQAFAQLGWIDGVNARIEVRWTNGNIEQAGKLAKELVSLRPDAIFSGSTPVTNALLQETRTIPVIFAVVSDPVGAGFVESLPRPGGNATGFINEEGVMGGKWLELLKEVAPGLTRAAIMFNPQTAPGAGAYFLDSFQAAARSMRMQAMTIHVRSDTEIESAIDSLGRDHAGLVVMTDSYMGVHRRTVIAAASRSKVPTIFDDAAFAREGGLMSYGPSYIDQLRKGAGYVDRVLHGAKPAELPVQVPTVFELAINLKTAKALNLDVPLSLQQRADEVIE